MRSLPDNDALDRELADLCNAPVPESFRRSWRDAVKREEKQTMKKQSKTFWRIALPVAAALVLVIGSITAGDLIPATQAPTAADNAYVVIDRTASSTSSNGLSAAKSSMSVSSDESVSYAADTAETTAMDGASADTGSADYIAVTEKKLVRTASVTLSTTDFDNGLAAIEQLVQSVGGYIEQSSVDTSGSSRYGRTAYYSLRIPSDKLDDALSSIGGIGRVLDRSETATDMTTQYADVNGRLQTQKDKLTRLNELLKQAENVSDLLEIENTIADTQYQIDSYERALRGIDRDVDTSAVSLTLREETVAETAQAVELTLGERIASGFRASIRGLGEFGRNLLVFLAMALPVLVPLTIVIVVIVLIVRKRRAAKRLTKQPDNADQPDKPTEP